ncbi:MAG: hypothetical protein R2681_09455, partial [Pyrinomonadaceae bacterium]
MRKFLVFILMFIVGGIFIPVFSTSSYAVTAQKFRKSKQNKRFKKQKHRKENRRQAERRFNRNSNRY